MPQESTATESTTSTESTIKGEILFPMGGTYGTELREDVAGMDLNGDGQIDIEDHSTDYIILPVSVKVEWNGVAGARTLTFHTLLHQPLLHQPLLN